MENGTSHERVTGWPARRLADSRYAGGTDPGMKRTNYILVTTAAILLAACLVAYYATRSAGTSPQPGAAAPRVNETPLVDERLLQTARQMSALADNPQEQDAAREALRLADHELDQAFSTALRQAAAVPAPASGPAQQLIARITQLKARLQAYEKRIADLTKQAAETDVVDELAVIKAQHALDEDALQDAEEDLTRQGGNRHAVLERALQEHEAVQRQPAPAPKPVSSGGTGTLLEQAQLWFDLNSRQQKVAAARNEAVDRASHLLKEHETLEAQPAQASNSANGGTTVTQSAVAHLQRLSEQRKTLTEYDKRIQDSRQLADVYERWAAIIQSRRSGVLHLILGSAAGVLAIVLVVIVINSLLNHAFRQSDRKRLHQLRTVAKLGVQLAGVLLVLLILFGKPTQMTTIIGLATAGLTVALKDFIVAFFGWFVLLGRQGIHIGDWVEIEGVGGEVIEIGLLKTVLLEVGNWTTTGHPTGRRVAFVNSFAIEGHFFNFTTAGQWLWDQLQVTLPSGGDPYRTAEQIAEVVARETEGDTSQAEEDWKRATSQYGAGEFSAKPAVELRPTGAGLDVIVRYVTRAPRRSQVKSKLFQLIVNLLHQAAAAAKPA